MKSIEAKEVAQYMSEGYVPIDVREPFETEGGTMENAKLIPKAELLNNPSLLNKDGAYIIYCHSGNRARVTCNDLEAAGFTNILHLNGGYGGYSKFKRKIKE